MGIEYRVDWIVVFLVFGLGFSTMGLVGSTIDRYQIEIDQEVLDDVCQQLTENKTAIGLVEEGGSKLVCELPSFDSTHNIIVRENGGE